MCIAEPRSSRAIFFLTTSSRFEVDDGVLSPVIPTRLLIACNKAGQSPLWIIEASYVLIAFAGDGWSPKSLQRAEVRSRSDVPSMRESDGPKVWVSQSDRLMECQSVWDVGTYKPDREGDDFPGSMAHRLWPATASRIGNIHCLREKEPTTCTTPWS